jgi:zinc transport system substrate-binding protein
MSIRLLGFAVLFAGCSVFATRASAAPSVVATIKPVHALVAGVMSGVGEPALLIAGSASPLSYTLRPSESRLLTQAQLIVRVGAGFETFLQRPLAGLAPTTRILTLDTLPGMRLLPTRSGGVWESHDHDDDHGERDLHLWLDPRNAQVIVAATAAALAELDPSQAARYHANAAQLQLRLIALDADLQQRLAPVQRLPYAVFHDAFAYLEGRYALSPIGAISVSSERPPGARRLAAIRARLRESGARCLFVQPQFEPKLAAQLISGTAARIAVLDDLGADLPAGPDAYFLLMERLGSALQDCLAPPP